LKIPGREKFWLSDSVHQLLTVRQESGSDRIQKRSQQQGSRGMARQNQAGKPPSGKQLPEEHQPEEHLIVSPGTDDRHVRSGNGQIIPVPGDWELLPPGDAALTRRVKAGGPVWIVQEKVRRKLFSRGIYAPRERIEQVRKDLEQERSGESYQRKLASGRARRERIQQEYVGDFRQAVLQFLRFAPSHAEIAEKLADAVTAHATPVGSGTVARTQRIPVEQRAESAVIAWMRHQTTAYDSLKIARVKGRRREVRRQLAEQSRRLLKAYRDGQSIPPDCPLQAALSGPAE